MNITINKNGAPWDAVQHAEFLLEKIKKTATPQTNIKKEILNRANPKFHKHIEQMEFNIEKPKTEKTKSPVNKKQ